ncbi:MAG TPA: sugar transferase [Gaiellaceae bacterium]|nr:sugar transferase [Gaiellaceae bacterium]
MNATERAALVQAPFLYEQMHSAVDERTLEILDRRRRTAVVRRRGWLVRRLLLSADLLGLTAAFAFAQLLTQSGVSGPVGTRAELLLFAAALPVWVVLAKLYGLYDRDEERTDHSTSDEVAPVLHMVTLGVWLTLVVGYLTGLADPTLPKVVTFWALAVGLVTLARACGRALARHSVTYLQNAVIVGAGEVGQMVAHKLIQHREYGINLVGFVDSDPLPLRGDIAHVALLGPQERLPAIIRLLDVERVILAFSSQSHEQTLDLVRSLKDLDVQIDIVPRLFEIVGPSVGLHTVEGLPLVGLAPLHLTRSSLLLKRTLDIAVSAAALILLAPAFAAIAWRIKADSPGPVFFRQVRMGAGGKTFRIFKFRTMVAEAEDVKGMVAHLNMHAREGGDPRMFKVPNDPRVTRLGAFLRRFSLDELPQLLNVLKGEMTLVGPRPLILDEDQFVADWARRRLELKPGVTGLWQVLGSSEIPFEEMTRLDYLYVTNWSLWGDLRLIAKTVPAVLRTRHAY